MVLARCHYRLRPCTAIATATCITQPLLSASKVICTVSNPNPVRQLSQRRPNMRNYATSDSTPSTTASPNDNPVLAEYLAQKRSKKSSAAKSAADQTPLIRGGLASLSVFTPSDPSSLVSRVKSTDDAPAPGLRNPAALAARLDPAPGARRRWERKMVIAAVRRRGRLSRAQIIRRTERELLARSEFYRTSSKKLTLLARQLAGKSIEDAIIQMSFSKKRVALDVHRHLLTARNRAIVERGMGLGAPENRAGGPVTVKMKDGSRKRILDRTGIYVAQAWVGKGPYGTDLDRRARGRINRLRLPQTSISVLLKEEHTRIREHEERLKREKAKKPWTPLPDRPITAQRPFYGW